MSGNTFNLAFGKHVPKINMPVSEQRKKWFMEFMKPFIISVLLYSFMYFVRDDFKAAQPLLKTQLHMTTTDLGLIGTAFSLAYGIGKIIVGYIVTDKDNKKAASIMLMGASIIVACFGFLLTFNHIALGWLLAFWAINGLFQCGAGPCCSGVIMNWTTKKNYGRYYGIWSASHNIGGGLAGMFALWCANTFFHGSVAGMFIAPAIVAFIMGIICFTVGKNRPEDLGWESTETIFGEPAKEEDVSSEGESTWTIFCKYLLKNPLVWMLCFSDVFAYIMRTGVDNWSSLRLTEQLGFSTDVGAQAIFYFGLGSMIGCITWGAVSDALKGRPALVSLICLAAVNVPMVFYQRGTTPTGVLISIFFVGLFAFGPQVLIGISLLNQVPKKAAALAGGLLGAFAYLLGDSTAKALLAKIADSSASGINLFGHVLHGWGDTFTVIYVAIACAFVIQLIVALAEEKKIRAARKPEVAAQ